MVDIDLTARDYDSLYLAAMRFYRQRVGDTRFQAVNNTDVIPNIIAVQAWFQSQANFYADRRERNAYLHTTDSRETAVLLARTYGYRARGKTSAAVPVLARLETVQAVPVTLRAGTVVTANGLSFELLTDAVIPPNTLSWPDDTTEDKIVFSEGVTYTETFQSDGLAQEYRLSRAGIADGSVTVTILGEVWERVDSLAFVEDGSFSSDRYAFTGGDNQTFTLSRLNPVVDIGDPDSVMIVVVPPSGDVNEAVTWQQVATFTGGPREFVVAVASDGTATIHFGAQADGSAPPNGSLGMFVYQVVGKQRRYQLNLDDSGEASVIFGDGTNGVMPQDGATISVSYRVGGGLRGNVDAGAINTAIRGYLPNGNSLNVFVQNIEHGSGGLEEESLDSIKFNAPRFAAANNRAVRREDFAVLARSFFRAGYGSLTHAGAFLKQRVPELNTVVIPAWSSDSNGTITAPNSALKAAVQQYLNSKRVVTVTPEVIDGTILVLDFDIAVRVADGSDSSQVVADVTAAINSFFRSTFVIPGQDVSLSQLTKAIQAVDNVDSFVIRDIRGGNPVSVVIGEGDKATNVFNFDLSVPEGLSVVYKSIAIKELSNGQSVVSDGQGGFTGDVLAGLSIGDAGNTVDLVSGKGSISFATVPPAGSSIVLSAVIRSSTPLIDTLPAADGSTTSLDSTTDYYPIVKRSPKGVWSGDQVRVIDGLVVGTSSTVRGTLSQGIIPGSLTITDSTGSPQIVTDDGAGSLIQLGSPVGTVNYNQGTIDFEFNSVPTKIVRATYNTNTVDLTLSDDDFPGTIADGRLYFWAGYGADGAQGFGELIAADDGNGNATGQVDLNETRIVRAEDKFVRFTWNTTPAPGFTTQTIAATLTQAPDGSRTTFDYTTGTDLSRGGAGGEGRLRFQLSDLSTVGLTFVDAYDNFRGRVHGRSLSVEETNTIDYVSGSGRITFKNPPAATAGTSFSIVVTNVVVAMHSAFVYRAPNPSGFGLDQSLFADDQGRFWGLPAQGPSNPYPTDRLDHKVGRYVVALAGVPVSAGREQEISYDALGGGIPSRDIPVPSDSIPTVGRVFVTVEVPVDR